MNDTGHWLDPVRRVLEDAARPVSFFFRDDDAGWEDDRLFRLLEVFEAHSIPIDLAVIPAEVSGGLARRLSDRLESSAGRIRVHQHGHSHANHEIVGKKCEFGPRRGDAEQSEDLKSGRRRLVKAFGEYCDPIFTPPWNRCTQTTADLLAAGSYRAISRISGARRLRLNGLSEISVCIDWSRWEMRPEGHAGLGRAIAGATGHGRPVGIMLHHAVMRPVHHAPVSDFIKLLAGHPNAKTVLMRSLIGMPD